jgi:hypothetical protein
MANRTAGQNPEGPAFDATQAIIDEIGTHSTTVGASRVNFD